jgi:hypothetical protein
MNNMNVLTLEVLSIEKLINLVWEYIHGSVISPEGEKPERENYEQIIFQNYYTKLFLKSLS